MKVKELIEHLQELDQELEVVYGEGFGGFYPIHYVDTVDGLSDRDDEDREPFTVVALT